MLKLSVDYMINSTVARVGVFLMSQIAHSNRSTQTTVTYAAHIHIKLCIEETNSTEFGQAEVIF